MPNLGLPDSGPIGMNQIAQAVANGGEVTMPISLRAISAAAGKSTPDAMSEFYGYVPLAPEGGTATLKYYAVENLIIQNGRPQRQKNFIGGWKLYIKPSSTNTTLKDYDFLGKNNTGAKHKKWITTINVSINSSGVATYSFPNGGYTTYGQQYYINIVSNYLSSTYVGGITEEGGAKI